MSLETSLVADLQGDPTIAALIGDRIYPLVVPQDVQLPALAYQVITGSGILAHSRPTSLANKRIQVACVGAEYADAAILADAIVALYRGFKGQLGGGVMVEFVEDVNQTDGQVDEYPSGYVRYLDLAFLHKETGG